jgi:3-phosphoshikimate 1-carboxyvinyltransferase
MPLNTKHETPNTKHQTLSSMIEIRPAIIKQAEITVPGSKSYTHRMLITAALSNGRCTLLGALKSEDTFLTLETLRKFGIPVEISDEGFRVNGTSGDLKAHAAPIDLKNSGTSMRFLTALAVLGKGRYRLTGSERMQQRPIKDLLDGLECLGVAAESVQNNGCPPVEIEGGKISGDHAVLNCQKSSQFLSGLLLVAPYTEKGLTIDVSHGPVSRPYIDMTLEVMEKFGVAVTRKAYQRFEVAGKQIYRSGAYQVEPDASQAGYFWAAAAITGADIKVSGITRESKQGDVRLAALFEQMGCNVSYEPDGIRVIGGPLTGIETDMADIPDMVPTLAVVAAFAKGTTVIRNVSHLAEKESNRLTAVAEELSKMGINTQLTQKDLMVEGGAPHGAQIATYNDHRIAMSFAVAGLRVQKVFIEEERCVEKSFPGFWNVFEKLYPK